jgi:cytochrome c peroxidase
VDEGTFQFHDQEFAFGPDALQGLRIFLAVPVSGKGRSGKRAIDSATGNCVACHAPPAFTDFSFHNTGVTQREYDAIHGSGAFARLPIPSLRQRKRNPDRFLPATAAHPQAEEPFRRTASAADARFTDLGVWNVFANPDLPAPQGKIWESLCEQRGRFAPANVGQSSLRLLVFALARCTPEALLPTAIARFKTPGLRDLGHSNPYMHDGAFDTLATVIGFYRGASDLARNGKLRNGDPELDEIKLNDADAAALVSFLQSLNEDYQ